MKWCLAFTLVLADCGSSTSPESIVKTNPHDGLWQDAEQPPFRLELEQTFGDTDEEGDVMLGGIGQVAVDDHGNVYVIDYQASTIVSFGPDGSHRWTTGSAGEGPGQLSRVRGLVHDGEGYLYVANLGASRFDRFDLDGNFVDSHPGEDIGAGGTTELVGMLGPDSLVVSSGIGGKNGIRVSVIGLDSAWAVDRSFEILDSIDVELPEMMPGTVPLAVVGAQMLAGSVGRYRLGVYDRFGRLERSVLREGVAFVPPFAGMFRDFPMVRFFSQLSVAGRAGGYTVARAAWPTNLDDPARYMELAGSGSAPRLERFVSMDIYGPDWTLLYSFAGSSSQEVGPISGLVAVDSRDRLYARMPDGVTLGRYRLEVDGAGRTE